MAMIPDSLLFAVANKLKTLDFYQQRCTVLEKKLAHTKNVQAKLDREYRVMLRSVHHPIEEEQ